MRSSLKEAYIREAIKLLTTEGERIIQDAYKRRDWKNQTFNLHDSYGSAVYVYGKLEKSSIRYVGPKQANAARNGKELGDYHGEDTKALSGSSHTEFGKSGNKKYTDGDTIQAYGRDEVNKFFEGYSLADSKGIELVVVAAMYYAGALEWKKYQVISSANSSLQKLAREISSGGKGIEVYSLDIERNREAVESNQAFKVKVGNKLI